MVKLSLNEGFLVYLQKNRYDRLYTYLNYPVPLFYSKKFLLPLYQRIEMLKK